MSLSAQPVDYADFISGSDSQNHRISSDLALLLSIRNIFIQAIAVCAGILVHFLRRQQIPSYKNWLDNWVFMPPECVIFTAVALFQGVPILKRDFRMLARLLGRLEEPAA